MKKENQITQKISTGKESIKILKIAAFCFAIISFIATAEGLTTYVFEYRWQAYLISFGIQSILFIFNLKLPAYFNKIGCNIPKEKKKMRKNGISYKWTFMQKIIALFYVMLLICSSGFSYVYIVNVAYEDTRYSNSNIVLDSNYRKFLNQTENYVNENIKVSQLLISEQLAELQELALDNIASESTITLEELEKERIKAENDFAKKNAAVKTQKEIFITAEKIYLQPLSKSWRSDEEREKEKESYFLHGEKLKKARQERNKSKIALLNIEDKINNYIPSVDEAVQGFLVEMLLPEPSLENYKVNDVEKLGMKSYMKTLTEKVIQLGESNTVHSNFSKMVVTTEEISITVNNYISLREILQAKGNNNDLNDMKNRLVSKSIEVPHLKSKKFQEELVVWKKDWKQHMEDLDKIIKTVPQCPNVSDDFIEKYKNMINFDLLKNYNQQKNSDTIDELVREHIDSTNSLVLAKDFLVCKYPFIAWFSILLALFFDIASLLAGLFIYYITLKKKKSQDDVYDE